MSEFSIQVVAPFIDRLYTEMRKAKTQHGYTYDNLSEISGVPYTTVCDFFSGRVANPRLEYVAALCIPLNLSLDLLTGLKQEDDSPKPNALRDRIRELETENAKYCGEIVRLEATNKERFSIVRQTVKREG